MAHILIVDDETALRRTLRVILEAAGHTVAEAGDGDEALVTFTTEAPDLVLTDIIMPNREGAETIGRLRRLAPDLPIVAMSGGGGGQIDIFLTLASQLGATRMIAKPIRQAVLLEVIAACLGDAGAP